MPFDGFKAVGAGTLIDTGGDTGFKLGSRRSLAGTEPSAERAGLCSGLAQGTESCGDQLAFLVGARAGGLCGAYGRLHDECHQCHFSSRSAGHRRVKDRQLSVRRRGRRHTRRSGPSRSGNAIPIDLPDPELADEDVEPTTGIPVRHSSQAVPRNLASVTGTTDGPHRPPLPTRLPTSSGSRQRRSPPAGGGSISRRRSSSTNARPRPTSAAGRRPGPRRASAPRRRGRTSSVRRGSGQSMSSAGSVARMVCSRSGA